MPDEAPAAKPRKPRTRRAAPAAPLPISARITLRGQRTQMTLECFQARQVGDFWVFVSPADAPGMVDVTRIAVDSIAVLVMRQWPTPELFQEGPRASQEPAGATQAPSRPPGPQTYVSPALEAIRNGAPLPENGAQRGFQALGSFSTSPFGGPSADLPAS